MIIKKINNTNGMVRCNQCKITYKSAKRKGIDLYCILPRIIDITKSYHINLCEPCLKILYKKLRRVFE